MRPEADGLIVTSKGPWLWTFVTSIYIFKTFFFLFQMQKYANRKSPSQSASKNCNVDCTNARNRLYCGTDGKQYISKCEIRRKRRCEGVNVDVLQRGECPSKWRIFCYVHYVDDVSMLYIIDIVSRFCALSFRHISSGGRAYVMQWRQIASWRLKCINYEPRFYLIILCRLGCCIYIEARLCPKCCSIAHAMVCRH